MPEDRVGEPRGWFSRGYLPHVDAEGTWQFVTFRLADALPGEVMERWRLELEEDAEGDHELLRRVERYLDAGHGSCLLGETRFGAMVEAALRYFDGERYQLAAWVVMPNHVHTLV
ncbi:MAG TPA: transposase, partial [Acidobacteria bacterium]|nr:transposase [Acidobacteriota bacterium]